MNIDSLLDDEGQECTSWAKQVEVATKHFQNLIFGILPTDDIARHQILADQLKKIPTMAREQVDDLISFTS